MREKILSRLRAKFPGVNLSKARMDAIADKLSSKITDETEIDQKLDDLNEILDFAAIAREDDRLRTAAQKAQDKDKDKDQDPNKDQDKDKDPPKDDMPQWAKALMGEVQSLRAEKAQSSIRSKVTEKLKDKVPEKFYKGRALPEKEEDLDAFVTEVEQDWTEIRQSEINQQLTGITPPGSGGAPASQIEADITAWAKGAS